jgi:hypothetical protein
VRASVSKVLERVSQGKIGFLRKYSPAKDIYGDFPHLINAEVVAAIKLYSDVYVECVSRAGLPQRLIDFTGCQVGVNDYYPAPEMHQAAAQVLYPVCLELLG